MSSISPTEPSDIPSKPDGGASATQLSILLSSAMATIDEEFKRSERLDAKSRNQLAVTGAFFAAVQAGALGLINGTLGGSSTEKASAFVPWLALTGAAAGVMMVIAAVVSYRAWRLRDDPALSMKTIRDYVEAARRGNPAVGVKLVQAYADIADGRRSNNATRASALDTAAVVCGLAVLATGIELVLAFAAVAVQ